MAKEQGKQFNVRMTPEEDRCLTERAALTHMTKSDILKQSLRPFPFLGEKLVYDALKNIDVLLAKNDTKAIREEMMNLCLSLNSLTRQSAGSPMKSTTTMNKDC